MNLKISRIFKIIRPAGTQCQPDKHGHGASRKEHLDSLYKTQPTKRGRKQHSSPPSLSSMATKSIYINGKTSRSFDCTNLHHAIHPFTSQDPPTADCLERQRLNFSPCNQRRWRESRVLNGSFPALSKNGTGV